MGDEELPTAPWTFLTSHARVLLDLFAEDPRNASGCVLQPGDGRVLYASGLVGPASARAARGLGRAPTRASRR